MRNPVLASLLAAAFFAFPAHAADLLQTYQDALANDAQYASARAAQVAGMEKSVQGRAGLLPSIGLSGTDTISRTRNELDLPGYGNGVARNSVNTVTLALTQPLFRWANWQQYEQGKLSVVASDAVFAQARQDLIVRVSQAYFDVLTAQDNLLTLQAQKLAISEQLASAKRNFDVGTSTITDTHEAQARYDLIVAQEFAGQSDLQVKRSALQQIIGKESGELAMLKPGIQLAPPQPQRIEDWVSSAEAQNFSVVASQVSVEIAKREIERNRAGHYPTVDLVASTGRNSSGGASGVSSTGVSNPSAIGVQWNIPLFAGFAVSSRVNEAIALTDKARNDFETARRVAALGARQAYVGVTSGLAQVKAYEAAEISSQSALDSNKLGYQVGVRINIDVLNAQQQLYTTRQTLAKARYDTVMSGLRLKAAAGILKEADLDEINAMLQH
ncbi:MULTISPECIES: TolC family outer membrane protein [unclassified Undibacterium]|uniref:TolC family outer membrane protein n=2 Tax=Pseudomonadati TaxID=3379134 RepID=UPI002AC9D613|nr:MULTISPECIES: TolC family outer membrane protein [unclassified Undibacterium]MEB0140103.1 TolC family outer membrane protein [Undibacterium sp. CCC2.1]MEB0173213.1 TolC family outer membrane protein [Undibacterium sp. CCC1.1]MEB0176926.1 TolC family outer membrane protein [Undibacterium sp. CCC3.4]MEB0216259.1 TolC family outer membrane protein [Undibacterium sp. 5I2]WPX44163.1 TolC family outer membrane protein [Undibacterium sp. CCC3.4]